MKIKKIVNKYFLYCFISSLIIPNSVNAYAGPGVAIGIILIIFTVIIAFFSSLIIKFYKISKRLYKKLFNLKKKNKIK